MKGTEHALLKSYHRDWLLEENGSEITESTKRTLREEIRNRMRRTLLDFLILVEAYPEKFRQEDIDQIFEMDIPRHIELKDGAEFTGPGAFENTIPSVLAFLYLADSQFELSIEQGVKRAKKQEGRKATADASVRVRDEGPITELYDKIKEGDKDASFDDITTLLAEGEITKDEADELFSELYGE